ncbi:hypothetical protein [Dyella sp. EPa41]|uniref:hypothetical protein n=1 Tax=Dyella sp. EPa41 TaxID=1561194 RepID=UPI001915194E|nr:hypothetical protein [Dyella sp. EPa41]
MASASYTNVSRIQELAHFPPVYVLPDDGELIFPGDIRHDVISAMDGLPTSVQRKLLTLAKITASGEFDILQTTFWTDDRKRAFIESLPEMEG